MKTDLDLLMAIPMYSRTRSLALGALVVAVVAVGTLLVVRARSAARELLPSTGDRTVPIAADRSPHRGPYVHPWLATPSAAEARPAPQATLTARTQAPEPQGDGLDGPSWKNAKLAFGMRELGKMGPYVKVGLEEAHREMGFCFRDAPDRASLPGADPEAPGPPPDPAVLLLYLEAREGAMDVVDSRLEHRGTSTPGLVECCRDVLRGFEIPAFGAVPGERYRVRFTLE